MCREALPEHLNDPSEIDAAFPDDSDLGKYWRWFKKTTKTWFVFGPRDSHWLHRWREWPVCLFKLGQSRSWWRYEDDTTSWYGFPNSPCYLSRVQYYQSWHVQVQWPLFIELQIANWEVYVGFKRDADKVYWLALYIGRTWK